MIELLDLKNDVVFKDFFGDKNSKEILESFINSVLGFEGGDCIEVEEFLDPRKMRVEVGKPSTFVDLSVKTRSGERYIIEMQTYNHDGFDKRLLYYLGKDYTEQIEYHYHEPTQISPKTKKLIGWRELPRVHIIAIIDFHRSQKDRNGILNHQEVVDTYRFKPEISASNGHIFDHWQATIVDLKKFKLKPVNQMETDKEKWIFLLNDAPSLQKEDVEVLRKDHVFQRALERLEMLSSDPKTRKAYEASVNNQRDHVAVVEAAEKIALEAGRQEGEKKKSLEIAHNLLKIDLPIEQIMQTTDLTLEEIKTIQN